MHAQVDSLEAVVVICGQGPRSHRAALDAIAAVDEPSRGVPMRQVSFHVALPGEGGRSLPGCP